MYNGTHLSDTREAKGITLSAASRCLSIPKSTLEALENSRLEALPPDCFTTGFLRSYCRFLELPTEDFVGAYQTALRSSKIDTRAVGHRIGGIIAEKFAKLIPPLPPELISWGAVTLVVLFAWLAYSAVFQPQARTDDTRASAAIHDLRLPEDTTPGR